MTTRIPIGVCAPRVVLLAAVLGAFGCEHKTNQYAPPDAPEVTVAHPIQKSVTRYLESTGTTEAYEIVELRARVTGFLDHFEFKPGAKVKKGDLLFEIDKRTYQAAVDRAAAQLHAAEAALVVAQSQAKIAEKLYAEDAGSEIDKITQSGSRESATASVEAAKAALESAQLDLEFCEVRAPIDGRITKNFVDAGNFVGAAGQATLLARIVNSKPMYVTIDASEDDVLMVRRARLAKAPNAEPGQLANGQWRPVDLATADSKDFDVHGRIDYVDPALDPASGTIRVRCRFENDDELLLPGLFVRIRIFQDASESTVVPDIALLSDPSGRFALVVNADGIVEARHVEIGALDGDLRVVTAGLTPADRIVVKGLQRARPGMAVKTKVREFGEAASQPASAPAGIPAEKR